VALHAGDVAGNDLCVSRLRRHRQRIRGNIAEAPFEDASVDQMNSETIAHLQLLAHPRERGVARVLRGRHTAHAGKQGNDDERAQPPMSRSEHVNLPYAR
jgi:hypothetical protein